MILSSEQDTLQAKGEQGLSVLFIVPVFALCSHCFNGHCGYDLACKYRSRVFSSLECCGHLKSVCHVLSQDQSQRRLNTINKMRCVSTFAHLFQLSWYFVQPICSKMGLHSGCMWLLNPGFDLAGPFGEDRAGRWMPWCCEVVNGLVLMGQKKQSSQLTDIFQRG